MTLWSQAASAAAKTPESRNRYVDFLRAVSIMAVISGHWLVASPFVDAGELTLSNMLAERPWTQWLTWVFQVMPVFFLVGGYSNGVSWSAAQRDGKPYAEWLSTRLQRLIGPVIPLLVAWAIIGAVAYQVGVDQRMIKAGSQMALVPTWFLAVYVMVVVLVPLTYGAWKRFGMASFWFLVVAAVIDDTLFFAADLQVVGWANYVFIWLSVHQLGYAWREGRIAGPRTALPWAVLGAVALALMVTVGPHPLSMVTVPGEGVSNSLTPKLPMLALGLVQTGLLLSLEGPARHWLSRATPWTATVLVNGMIMTIFLWHLTASSLVVGLSLLAGNVGLTLEPGSGAWWAIRPFWMLVYVVALVPFTLLFGRFERGSVGVRAPSWRLVTGAALVCGGLALLALDGVGGDGLLGLRLFALSLPFVGAVLAGVVRVPQRA